MRALSGLVGIVRHSHTGRSNLHVEFVSEKRYRCRLQSGDRQSVSNWLVRASATNMAYALSAQLAAMQLNVRHNFVNGSALVYAPGYCFTARPA